MHSTEHPAPSRSRRQMHQRLENAGQPRPESTFPTVVGALRIHRPVNQERPPHDGIPIDESPVAAVPDLLVCGCEERRLQWGKYFLVAVVRRFRDAGAFAVSNAMEPDAPYCA